MDKPGQVYICPAGNHPIFLYGNGTIVPHYDAHGCPCSANHSHFDPCDRKLPLVIWQNGREILRLPGDSWRARLLAWICHG